MRAISLWQPWASLVVHGKKRIETRDYAISEGPIAIHAAQRWTREQRSFCMEEPFLSALTDVFGEPNRGMKNPFSLPLGGVIGTVIVDACLVISDRKKELHMCPPPEPERSFGNYSDGRFAILLRNPIAFSEPRPYKGAQRIFHIPNDVMAMHLPARLQVTMKIRNGKILVEDP